MTVYLVEDSQQLENNVTIKGIFSTLELATVCKEKKEGREIVAYEVDVEVGV